MFGMKFRALLTKTAAIMATVFFGLMFTSVGARAEITYLQDFPGWGASVLRNGTIRISRSDRSMAAGYIQLLPMAKTAAVTKEAAFAQIETLINKVADDFKKCAPLKGKKAKFNGMGFEVKDRDVAPKCYLFIGFTKQGLSFANLRLEDGNLKPESLPNQQAAKLFMQLAVKRLQGKVFLKKKGDKADLSKFIAQIHPDNIPVKMLAVAWDAGIYGAYFGPDDDSKGMPLMKDHTASSCSNWDPSFYTPFDLVRAKAKPSSIFEGGNCKAYVWKKVPETDETMLTDGKTWKSAAEMLGENVTVMEAEPFGKGEKLRLMMGDKDRLSAVLSGKAKLNSLMPHDALFTSDGLFLVGNIGLANRPLHLSAQQMGRYYFDGHIMVLELTNGPVLLGYGGKMMSNGLVKKVFFGGATYTVKD